MRYRAIFASTAAKPPFLAWPVSPVTPWRFAAARTPVVFTLELLAVLVALVSALPITVASIAVLSIAVPSTAAP
jgi:hypothetical protein